MRATEILKEEHQMIIGKLEILRTDLDSPLNESILLVEKAIKFIREYADEYHHAKEEGVYFKWLCEKNPMFNEDGPVQVMLSEHEQGRELVENAITALEKFKKGDLDSETILKSNLLSFISLLIAHIDKEDHILYPMADDIDQIGDEDGDIIMLPEFERLEAEYLERSQN